MEETTRLVIGVLLGAAFVVWQALQDSGRAFAAILLVSGVLYAFSPVMRHGVA